MVSAFGRLIAQVYKINYRKSGDIKSQIDMKSVSTRGVRYVCINGPLFSQKKQT